MIYLKNTAFRRKITFITNVYLNVKINIFSFFQYSNDNAVISSNNSLNTKFIIAKGLIATLTQQDCDEAGSISTVTTGLQI